MKAYLHTEDMTVGYQGKALIEHIALEVRRGEIMTIIGPNGSGKSTILKSIIKQLRLISGAVYLEGQTMSRMTDTDVAKRLSILMTERVNPELMTCEDVVATGRYPYTGRFGILTSEDRKKVWDSLRLVHAEDLAGRDFSQVSDGQRQRILLARALCQEPEVIVMDEPTSFLDIRHKLELLAILKDMVRQKNLAVLMSLHELELAQKVSDYVVCLHNNVIERCGPPEEIFTDNYIMELFDASRGSYNADFGCMELERIEGTPKVFVIGGGGSGIALYRQLQRRGIPFAAGVLHKNDLDYPVANALASQVVEEEAFAPVGDTACEMALELMRSCQKVFCPLTVFGAMNEKNCYLRDLAMKSGWMRQQGSGALIG